MARFKTQWANIHFSEHSLDDQTASLPAFLPPSLLPFLSPYKSIQEIYIGIIHH